NASASNPKAESSASASCITTPPKKSIACSQYCKSLPGNEFVDRICAKFTLPCVTKSMANRPKPIVLTVLDGWGFRAETKGNAVALARKPNYDQLIADFPNTLIHTSGPYVGLPEGQMGNS